MYIYFAITLISCIIMYIYFNGNILYLEESKFYTRFSLGNIGFDDYDCVI